MHMVVDLFFLREHVRHFIDQYKPLHKVCRMQSGIEFLKIAEIKCSAKRAKVCVP
jgi:preprotein translocase subunit Sss1